MQRQKRDLALLLIFQTLAVVFGSVLGHPDSGVPNGVTLTLIAINVILLEFLLYKVTASYASTVWFKVLYAGIVILQALLNAITNGDLPIEETRTVALIAYPLSMIVIATIFYLIVRDMFANRHEITYSLLAASNAYILIATIFGYLYAFLAVLNPAIMGTDVTTGQRLVQRNFEVSNYVMAGFGVPESVSGMIVNLAVVEAFVANLYIIFVVGRLMANQK